MIKFKKKIIDIRIISSRERNGLTKSNLFVTKNKILIIIVDKSMKSNIEDL